MLRTQLEALNLKARECATVEELTGHSSQKRVVLVDVSALYDSAEIAQVHNLAEEEEAVVLLVTPLSMQGIPEELQHLQATTKPTRVSSLVGDIMEAMSDDSVVTPAMTESGVMRFEERVLLVEDMTANQEIARAMLESFGCSVEIAKNGAVALEMFQQEEYDLVLMDCQMPVMDGFEATRHIRQLESQKKGVVRKPIVALTAGKTEMEKERCYASGMDRILFKPYSTIELNNVLYQYFEPVGEVETPKNLEATPETGGEILDVKALDNIRSVDVSGKNELLRKVFDNFKQDVQDKIEELRANNDNPAILGAGAHAIKSMALNMGAKALSAYCRQLEMDWKNQLVSDSRREIEVLNGHYMDAVRALEQLIEPQVESIS